VKSLNQMRKAAPDLDYGEPSVTRQILEEARSYFRLVAALEPFRNGLRPGTAAGLLARSIDERLRNTLERLFRLLGLRYPHKQIYAAYIAVSRRQTEEFAAALEFLDNVLDRELKKVLMPLLDAPGNEVGASREMFGVEPLSAEAAIRELIRSSDPWLKACAMAAAAELKLAGLREEISAGADGAGADVTEVARAAVAALG
jgi:AAA family ATP:ADP antiporter